MGKGDRRTRRGKLFRGSHGRTRPKGPRSKPPPEPARPGRRSGAGSRPA
jgi:30S ribosomal protein S31